MSEPPHPKVASRRASALLLRLACVPLALSLSAGVIPPDRASAVRRPHKDLAANPAARAEHFVLEALDAGGHDDAVVELGICVWRRRDFEGGTHLEREVVFERGSPDLGRVIVRHVEELSYDFARLVWREQGLGTGRTLFAEWTREDDCIRAAEWSLRQSWRELQSAAHGAVMPLYLFELARSGGVTAGSFLVCDPVAQSVERLELSTTYSVEADEARRASPFEAAMQRGAGDQHLRTVELVRADGTLAARYAFRREELVGFQFQDGASWARRITAEEYRARMDEVCASAPSSEH